jgi:hypothetical protein
MNHNYIHDIRNSMSSDINILYNMDPIFHAQVESCMSRELSYTEILENIVIHNSGYREKITEYKINHEQPKLYNTCGMCGDVVDANVLVDMSDKELGYEMYACKDCIDYTYECLMPLNNDKKYE